MASTQLSNIVIPEVFTPNVIERTSEKFEFLQAGVVSDVGDIPIGRGQTIELPFFQDLSGNDNVWNETDISLNNITMSQDTAVVLTREKAWGRTDLTAALGQSDPEDAILELVAGFWSRSQQKTLIQTLNGAMGAVTENVSDISTLSSSQSNIDRNTFIDATQKLGDQKDNVTAVAMHSATEAWLNKNDDIDFIPDSEGRKMIRTFLGHRVIVDDGMPVSSGVYTTYIFGPGAVSRVQETVENADEVFRHPELKGATDALYTRRKFILHPRGVRWTPGSGVPASTSPTNAELAASANWTRVWEAQNIRVVKFVHTIG